MLQELVFRSEPVLQLLLTSVKTLMYSGVGWFDGLASGGKGLLAAAHIGTLPDLRPFVNTITITAENLQQWWTAELGLMLQKH